MIRANPTPRPHASTHPPASCTLKPQPRPLPLLLCSSAPLLLCPWPEPLPRTRSLTAHRTALSFLASRHALHIAADTDYLTTSHFSQPLFTTTLSLSPLTHPFTDTPRTQWPPFSSSPTAPSAPPVRCLHRSPLAIAADTHSLQDRREARRRPRRPRLGRLRSVSYPCCIFLTRRHLINSNQVTANLYQTALNIASRE